MCYKASQYNAVSELSKKDKCILHFGRFFILRFKPVLNTMLEEFFSHCEKNVSGDEYP